MKIFRYSSFDHKRNEEILEMLKVDPVDEKLEDTNQICYDMNKNEQQDAKCNAEL
jgi:hypothetical protein